MPIVSQYGFGLELRSDLGVPGAIDVDPRQDSPIVRIGLTQPAPAGIEPQFELDGGAIVYRNPAGTFRCLADRIEIAPSGPPDLEDIGALLIANALPAVLWLRGAFVLHAACVRLPDGRTIAIAGPSGSGKSTLAASLVEAGSELVGDDSLALTLSADGVLAAGLPGGWYARQKTSATREFQHLPQGSARGVARLDLLLVLTGAGQELSVSSPLRALELLLQNRHRPQVPKLLGLQAENLSNAARIVQKLPVCEVGGSDGLAPELRGIRPLLDRLADEARCGRRSPQVR